MFQFFPPPSFFNYRHPSRSFSAITLRHCSACLVMSGRCCPFSTAAITTDHGNGVPKLGGCGRGCGIAGDCMVDTKGFGCGTGFATDRASVSKGLACGADETCWADATARQTLSRLANSASTSVAVISPRRYFIAKKNWCASMQRTSKFVSSDGPLSFWAAWIGGENGSRPHLESQTFRGPKTA
jgi:hypothetical protein